MSELKEFEGKSLRKLNVKSVTINGTQSNNTTNVEAVANCEDISIDIIVELPEEMEEDIIKED